MDWVVGRLTNHKCSLHWKISKKTTPVINRLIYFAGYGGLILKKILYKSREFWYNIKITVEVNFSINSISCFELHSVQLKPLYIFTLGILSA